MKQTVQIVVVLLTEGWAWFLRRRKERAVIPEHRSLVAGIFLQRDRMKNRIGAGSYMLWASVLFIVWAVLTVAACELLANRGMIDLSQLNHVVSWLGLALSMVFYGLSARRLIWLTWFVCYPTDCPQDHPLARFV
jgi:hypothetical protein